MLIQCLFQLINGNEHELHTSFKNVPKRNMQMKTQIQNNDMFKLVILYDDTFFFLLLFQAWQLSHKSVANIAISNPLETGSKCEFSQR